MTASEKSGFGASVAESVGAVRRHTDLAPTVALVLGSGLGGMAADIERAVHIPYSEIPHFALSTAPGHLGELVLGDLEGRTVVAMAGRVHMYEGYSPHEVAYPIEVVRALGAEIVIVTNAAGGVNTDFSQGALMLIADHINLTGRNPLVGSHDAARGVRFPDMTEAYSVALRQRARQVAREAGLALVEGVYLGLLGPNYETPAEVRMARTLGADAVGMSTVMEVLVANQLEMQVLGLSCITNMAAGILPGTLSEDEVIETAQRVRGHFSTLVKGVVRSL